MHPAQAAVAVEETDSLMEHHQVTASSVEVLQAADHMDLALVALVVPWMELRILVVALACLVAVRMMVVVLASALEGLEVAAADTKASAYHLVLVAVVVVDSPEEDLTAIHCVEILLEELQDCHQAAVETMAAGRVEDLGWAAAAFHSLQVAVPAEARQSQAALALVHESAADLHR